LLDLNAVTPTAAQAPTWPWLAPGTTDQPTTAIFFAMKDTLDVPAPDIHELKSQWRRFLDLNRDGEDGSPNTADDDLTQDTMVIDVGTTIWTVDDRDQYDGYGGTDGTIVLQRLDPDGVNLITVDRVDRVDAPNNDFRDAVNEMGDIVIEADPNQPPGVYVPLLPGDPYPGLDMGLITDGFNHWVQWVRFTRAWGVDVSRDYI
jgi:hypothetical protein